MKIKLRWPGYNEPQRNSWVQPGSYTSEIKQEHHKLCQHSNAISNFDESSKLKRVVTPKLQFSE